MKASWLVPVFLQRKAPRCSLSGLSTPKLLPPVHRGWSVASRRDLHHKELLRYSSPRIRFNIKFQGLCDPLRVPLRADPSNHVGCCPGLHQSQPPVVQAHRCAEPTRVHLRLHSRHPLTKGAHALTIFLLFLRMATQCSPHVRGYPRPYDQGSQPDDIHYYVLALTMGGAVGSFG